MSYLDGVVYSPPSAEYPALIVIFKSDGDILAARAAPSVEEADAFLARVVEEVRAKIGDQLA